MALTGSIARGGINKRDPFKSYSLYPSAKDTTGRTARNTVVNPAHSTLVVILAGQSLNTGFCPTTFIPTNTANIDNFNPYDGSIYPVTDVCLGGSGVAGGSGLGNLNVRLYDTLITDGKFDRVIFGIVAVPSRSIYAFAQGGDDADRIGVMMRRLAWRGITPGMTGTTWVMDWMIGESDNLNGMDQATWQRGFVSANAIATAEGFSGTVIVHKETYVSTVTSAAIQAAQAAVVGGSVKAGADIDAITTRQGDGIHPTDGSAATMATAKYDAYQAAGVFV